MNFEIVAMRCLPFILSVAAGLSLYGCQFTTPLDVAEFGLDPTDGSQTFQPELEAQAAPDGVPNAVIETARSSIIHSSTASLDGALSVPEAEFAKPITFSLAARIVEPNPLSLAAANPAYGSAEVGRVVNQLLHQRSETHKDWAERLDTFYRQYGYQPVWYRSGWSAEADVAYKTLTQAWSDGLPPYRYLPPSLASPEQTRTIEQVAELELALTQGLLLMLPELEQGIGAALTEKGADLHEGLNTNNLAGWIEAIRPQGRQYQGLRRAVQSLSLDQAQLITIAVNMHRLRFQSAQQGFDKQIVVNIPAFRLDAYDQGQHSLTMAVVVGQPDRQTPEMQDRIVNLKFSPDWTVPSVSAKQDILPLLKLDAKQLVSKMQLQAFRKGKYVDPLKVNWSRYSASNLPYTFRQKPGPQNALGGVRFSMTNNRAIFLHDTPERSLFARGVRSVSSGCVRVEDAQELSEWILNSQKTLSSKQVGLAMTSGRTKFEKLHNPVAVDLIYQTAIVDQQGYLQIYPDIYAKDFRLSKELGLRGN